MKKQILFLVTVLYCSLAFSQNKKISLDDAVLQQNRKFRADRMLGFQWVPNSNQYAFCTEGFTKLNIANVQDNKALEWTKISDVNLALNIKITNFFGFTVLDKNTIFLQQDGKFFTYNILEKKGTILFSNINLLENTTLDLQKKNLAFTEGNNLFYLNDKQEKTPVTSNEDKNIVSGQTISRSEFGISGGIFWSAKSTFLAFYQKDETLVANYPILNINTIPGTLENIKYPMIGQPSEKVRVGIYNLATKNTVFIAPKGNIDDYMTNLTWTPDEKFLIIAELNRGQNDMRLNLYDATTGNFIRTILQEKNSKWVEPEHDAFFPSKTSNNFVWFSEQDGFQNLYYYDLTGKLIKKLTNNLFPVREITGANNTGTEIYFTATGENGTNMLGYKLDLKGKQTVITKDLGVHSLVVSEDGNYVFDEFSNHNTPSKSIIYDKNLKATTVLESKNKYEGFEIGTSEVKTIKAADGVTDLYTRLIKPSNFDASKKYPVLVYVYGGPHAQLITNSFLDGANLWMYWMAEQGYLIFTVDNRGSDNRGFAFESSIHQRLGVNEMADQLKGVDYLKSLPFVDANRLAVHGWSFGGFMTTSLMLRQPNVFKVGVAGGPVTDWNLYEVMYGERYMDTPTENPKGFEESNTLNYVKNLNGKLLLIHGTSDNVVVMQNNFALIKKFIEAEKQVDFFPYPMHEHNVQGKDRVHLMRKVLDYVIENNK
jgi:dipeptidyl-peptidase 4